MTYLIVAILLAMCAPAAIWVVGRVASCGLLLVAALGRLIAASLFALAAGLDRRRQRLR